MTSYVNFIYLGMLVIASNFGNSLSGPSPGNEGALKTISNSVDQFSADLSKTLAANQPNNLICSPLSLFIVLSMLASGAGGRTAKELRSGLHLSSNDAVTRCGMRSLIEKLNATNRGRDSSDVKNVTVSLANGMFVGQNFEVKSEFKKILVNTYKSEIQNMDFSNPQTASSIINAWASANTNGLIKQVIEPGDVAQAVLVLINAVYFKGKWGKEFDKSLTTSKTFYINENTTTNVPMMNKLDTCNYGDLPDLDAKFIELPYASGNGRDAMSMFIIPPNTPNGLAKVENNLSKVDFKQIHERRRMTYINIYLPKFKIESSLNLESTLAKMGMGRMFSNGADFSGISKTSLKVSAVIQKAFIDVNEEGSEAAAVTVGGVRTTAAIIPITVEVDRPFFYSIVHIATNTVLFSGHCKTPSS